MAREIQTVFNKIHITTPQFLNARWQRFLARFTQQALNHDWVLAAWDALTTAVIFHLGTDVVIIWVSLAIAQRSLLWMLRVFFNSFPFDRLVGLKSFNGGLQEKRGNSFFFFFFCRRAALYSATLFDCGSETWPLNNATVGQAGYCTFNFSNVKSSIIHRWLMRYSPLSTQCIQASTCVERWLHSIFVFFIYLSFLCMYI